MVVPGLMLSRAILTGIVVGQELARIARRIAVVGRGDGADDQRQGLARIDGRIDEIAAAGDGVAARRVADVPRVPERRGGRGKGEGKPVLPGVIGAQHVGQVGAVGVEVHAGRIGGAEERVGLSADEAGVHVAAAALADLLHELLEPPLVALGPGRAHDAPLPGGRWRLVRCAGSGRLGLRVCCGWGLRMDCSGWACGPCGSSAAVAAGWAGSALGRARGWARLAGAACLKNENGQPSWAAAGSTEAASTNTQPTSTIRIPLPPSRGNNSGLDFDGGFSSNCRGLSRLRPRHRQHLPKSVAIQPAGAKVGRPTFRRARL